MAVRLNLPFLLLKINILKSIVCYQIYICTFLFLSKWIFPLSFGSCALWNKIQRIFTFHFLHSLWGALCRLDSSWVCFCLTIICWELQAARETGALQAAKNKLEKQVEELTWRLQLEKRMRVSIFL